MNHLVLATGLSCLMLGASAHGQVTGSIRSTSSNGTPANIFKNQKDVYLSTGNCSNGLGPDGTYYFQVTDPSGEVLLSSDSVSNRRIVVSGGLITGTVAPGHSTKNGPCGPPSKVVKLASFGKSPLSSNEYKVWVTREEDYVDPALFPGTGFHGFMADLSKTDNFKVKGGKPIEQTTIHGTVFYDYQDDGQFDPAETNEVPLAGWRIEMLSAGQTFVTFTDADGQFEFIRETDGAQHVLTSIAPPPGFVGIVGGRWLNTTPLSVPVLSDVPDVVVDFGNLFLINTPGFKTSKGFWQNQGENLLAVRDPEWRVAVNALCLRKTITIQDPGVTEQDTIFQVSMGVDFDTAYQELRDFLVGNATLGVKANILSTQYCAAMLNSNFGPLEGLTTYIDQQSDDVLVDLQVMAANTLMLLCDPCSADTAPGGDPACIAAIEQCLDEWGEMNADGSNTYTRSEEAGAYGSPYSSD